MNLLKKSIIGVSLLFLLGFIIVSTYKAEAAISVTISATNSSVSYNTGTTLTWSSSGGATSCTLSRSDGGLPVTVGTSSSGYATGSLTQSTTFTLKCTNGKVFYSLRRCGDNLTSWETIEYPIGTWSTGNVIQGATGMYYRITGSNDNDDPSKTNIQLIGSVLTACP
ncbi:MAG TPA: hypothetical protein VK153_00355 [Candidatus Paceibacterota bacterium]|nr:hypothetical protein [Candidatus Paceibacterota bacterium]